MLFNAFCTIFQGVIGGIISSLIVSRVFLIQSEYQVQIKYADSMMRRIGRISYALKFIKKFLVDFRDTEVDSCAIDEKEEWLSIKDVVNVLHEEIVSIVNSVNLELDNNPVNDDQLRKLIKEIVEYGKAVSCITEYTSINIEELKKQENLLYEQYNNYLSKSKNRVLGIIMKDKVMIILYIIIIILSVGMIITSPLILGV